MDIKAFVTTSKTKVFQSRFGLVWDAEDLDGFAPREFFH